jgi:hypothetical protein
VVDHSPIAEKITKRARRVKRPVQSIVLRVILLVFSIGVALSKEF